MHFRILAKIEKAPPERSLNFFLKECNQGVAAGSRRLQSTVCRGVLSEVGIARVKATFGES